MMREKHKIKSNVAGNAQACGCYGVRMGWRKTSMRRLDWSFTTCKIRCRAFTVGQATLKAALSKVTKHEKVCFDNQHAFIPFAFNTFGFLAREVVDLLHRVQKSCIAMSCLLSP